MSPGDLDRALAGIPRQAIPNVLVGFDEADDAGVYRLTDHLALVQTVDFFSPIVDDPFVYGQIAAANALSDIYAMGGNPVTALSIVGFPSETIEPGILESIMTGGLRTLDQAGVALLGGHSVRDEEVKFGYAITGTIDPARIWTNRGAQVGDRILLTKPLGTGLITTALKRNQAEESHVDAAVRLMTTTNLAAARASARFRIHAVTDISGFGLIGHATEVARASGLTVVLHEAKLPVLDGALDYSSRGFCAGGLESNREFFSPGVHWSGDVSAHRQSLMYDPQTSGGLLVFAPEADTPHLLAALRSEGVDAVEIGFGAPPENTPIRID